MTELVKHGAQEALVRQERVLVVAGPEPEADLPPLVHIEAQEVRVGRKELLEHLDPPLPLPHDGSHLGHNGLQEPLGLWILGLLQGSDVVHPVFALLVVVVHCNFPQKNKERKNKKEKKKVES